MPILYKFLPKERTTYFDNELLRFTPPGALNDPYECLPSISDKLANTVLAELKTRSKLPLRQLQCLSREERRKRERVYTKALSNDKAMPKNSAEVRKMYTDKVVNGMNKTVGILSLSRRWNISLMWAHYTASHTGFCIGFNSDHQFFREEERVFGEKLATSPVNYSKLRSAVPRTEPSPDDLQSILLTKPEEWAYEEEERLIKMLENADQTIKSTPFSIALFRVPHCSVSEVILGTNAPLPLIKAAKQFAKDKNIPLYKAILSDRNFDLERRSI